MSPRVADPAVRAALIEQAARIIADEGQEALTLRRLSADVGTSTMAVYTHFGGMDELRDEVRREGFARLADHIAGVETTDDPVADLAVQGWAYYTNATTNPHLYRAMFMDVWKEDDVHVGLYTFESLVAAVERCIDAGRFRAADARSVATQLWAALHGSVALELVGLLSPDEVIETVLTTARHFFVGFGDTTDAVDRSLTLALERAGQVDPSSPV